MKLIVPYFVYTTLYVLSFTVGGIRYSPSRLLVIYASGNVTAHLYYIVTLVAYTLLTPLFLKCVKSRARSVLVFALGPITMVIAYAVLLSGSGTWDFWLGRSAIWLPYYYAGILFGIYKPDISAYRKYLWPALALFYIFELLESWFHGFQNPAFSTLRLSASLYSFTVILIAYSAKPRETCTSCIQRALKYIGDNSYAIYLMHMAFMAVLSKVAIHLGIADLYPIWSIVEVLLTLGISLVSIKIVRLVIPARWSRLFLGI